MTTRAKNHSLNNAMNAAEKCAELYDEITALRSLAGELVEGLEKLAVVFALPSESSNERFERVALQFYKETGYVAPGKDCRLYSQEERQEVYDKWFHGKAENARTLVAKAKEQVK